jgi:serine/threonine-protein kinase
MKIPGLGCFKGCLTMILVVVVILVLAWYTTPLPQWVDTVKSVWSTTTGWIGSVWSWVSALGNQSGGAGG